MIYSRSAEYALRALVHIATLPPGEFTMAKTIAADANIPAPFLAKILQDLTRDGFLKSNKGPGGGFRLSLPAEDLSMLHRRRSRMQRPRRLRHARLVESSAVAYHRVLGGDFYRRLGESPRGEAQVARPSPP
jgi:DNA-binding IclR family transcriptional regulator